MKSYDILYNYCLQISDAAITGIDMKQQIIDFEQRKVNDNATPPQTIEHVVMLEADNHNVEENVRHPFKISLRSKAEEEIVNDAKRKKVMWDMYEISGSESMNTGNNTTGYSVNQLCGLRVLNLTACNKISDVSLKCSMHLNELKELSLSKCQQITTMGIECLVKHCPSLEIVNLSECHNINDKTIELLTIHLKRLTHLYLERCIQLTDHSLDSMAINCACIKYVDVRGCRSMCSEPNLRLVNLTSIKYVSMSKPGPYVVDVVQYKQPKPPPMPLVW